MLGLERIITKEVVEYLSFSICREAHRLSKRATTNVLRSISKHSAQYSQAIVDQGGVELIVEVLLEFDPSVKEIAAGTIGNIARHTPALAQIAVDRGAVESLADLINVRSFSLDPKNFQTFSSAF